MEAIKEVRVDFNYLDDDDESDDDDVGPITVTRHGQVIYEGRDLDELPGGLQFGDVLTLPDGQSIICMGEAPQPFSGTPHKLGKDEDEKIVVQVKTQSFGTILVEAKPSYTILKLRQALGRKIEQIFEGFDVALMASSNAHGCAFLFDGHRLEDECTLAYYNIQQESTIRATFGLLGGGTYVSFCFISFHFLFSFGNAIKCNKCLNWNCTAVSTILCILCCICLIHKYVCLSLIHI